MVATMVTPMEDLTFIFSAMATVEAGTPNTIAIEELRVVGLDVPAAVDSVAVVGVATAAVAVMAAGEGIKLRN
jgi:hypothetical protein